MSRFITLKMLALGISLLFNFHMVFADHLAACPSIEELQALHFDVSFPYGFDNHTKSMKFVAVADKFSKNDEDDYVFVVYPITMGAEEDPKLNLRTLVGKLQSESLVPFKYNITNHIVLPMCVYTLPENNKVNALVYFDNGHPKPNDPEFMQLMGKKGNHNQMKQLIKQVFLK